MARIDSIDPAHATGQAKELLDAVHSNLGVTPNMTKAMAGSAVLAGYLGLSGALGAGAIRPAVAERIALAVAEHNGCSYCLSAHSYLAEHAAKIPADDIDAARNFRSSDAKAAAILRFAHTVVRTRGAVSDGDFETARSAGVTDTELAEVVGHIAVNVLTNYFNKAFQVGIDFPVVHPHEHATAA